MQLPGSSNSEFFPFHFPSPRTNTRIRPHLYQWHLHHSDSRVLSQTQVFILVQCRHSCSPETREWYKVPEHKQKLSPYIPNITEILKLY